MTDLVLDASASVDLLLDTPTGRRLQERLPAGARWWVPAHFDLEVGSTLRRAELNGRISPEKASSAFGSLIGSHAIRVSVRPLLPDAWAKRHNLTVADALYVVLAEHLQATLVTTDVNLANAPTLTVPTIVASP